MPFLKGISNKYQFQISTNFKSIIGHLKFEIRNWKFQSAFTLIELLIVISIFAITASLITASYLTFERHQRLKNAAQQIKSDIRFTQNQALTGDKGKGAGSCSENSNNTLVGYYMEVTAGDGQNESYTIRGNCIGPGSNFDFNERVISFSRGVKINLVKYGSSSVVSSSSNPRLVDVLFRPLEHDVTFWDSTFVPPFDDTGQLLGGGSEQTSDLTIELCREKTPYNVIIRISGEVYEKQPTGVCTVT